MKNASNRLQKLEWLLNRPLLWQGYPNPDVGNHDRLIFITMQRAGMFSLGTRWYDTNIPGLICEARRIRRERSYKTDTGKPYAPKTY